MADDVREKNLTNQRAGVTHEVGDLYRLLVDRVRDYAIFALDPDGYILNWNQGAQRLKGYTAEEAIGRHFSMFYPEVDLAAGKPAWELEVAKATGQVEDEGWRVRKDGTRFWASVLITALRDDSGELIGFAKVTRDLTERRRAEDELRQSEERFRLLVDAVKEYAIFMLDPSGHVTTWNAGAERINGYSAAEMIGKHFSVLMPPADVATGKPERELRIAEAEGFYDEEGWRIRKDGSRFWASVAITPVRAADGRLAGFAKVTRDLSEQRAAREAEMANRTKSEFLAAMSHELRTPLNAIGGYTQLLQMEISGPLTPEQREQLSRINRSQEHLLGIINDILNFSRIEAGEVAYDIGDVPLAEVVRAVVPMIGPQALSRHLHLSSSVEGNDIAARADRAKVEQILLNLLSNATKFTPEGGRIEVRAGRDERGVWLSVTDTGIGIPFDQLEQIFSPFVQVGRSLANPKEGTGLGLSISRDLARAMHGELTATSRPGQGSVFTVHLPAAD